MCIMCGDNVNLLKCVFFFFNFKGGSLNIVSNFFIDGMCVVAFAHATNTMSGATFHTLEIMLSMSGWYFVVFLSRLGFMR
jgi:hypothetical protein